MNAHPVFASEPDDSGSMSVMESPERSWLTAILLGAALIFCYGSVATALVAQWISNDMYSYAFAVPLLSGYVAWHVLERNRLPALRASYGIGIPVLGFAIGLLIVGRLGSVLVAQELSLVVAVAALVVMFFGVRAARLLWFPLVYLFFMVPVWDISIDRMHWVSQLASAKLAVGLLHALGLPALLNQTLIVLPTVTLEVARECSGINQLVAVFAIAAPLAYVTLDGFWRRAFLVCFALAVASISNGVRVALIGVWIHYGWPGGDVHGPFHILKGLAVSFVGYGAIFMCQSLLSARSSANDAALDLRGITRARLQRSPAIEAGLTACVLLVAFQPIWFHPVDTPLTARLSDFPSSIEGFSADADTSVTSVDFRLPGVDDELIRTYRDISGSRLKLYIGYLRRQEQGKELVGSASARLVASASALPLELDTNETVSINHILQGVGSHARQGLFWYDINGRVVANPYSAKAYSIQDALLRRRSNGALVMVHWEAARDTEAGPLADERRRKFVKALIPLIRQHVRS
jgi:EpsI family protein